MLPVYRRAPPRSIRQGMQNDHVVSEALCNLHNTHRTLWHVRPQRSIVLNQIPWKGVGEMTFLGFLLLGLIAGAIAKALLPGTQGGGWFITLILGVVGALLGGWLGSVLFNRPLTEFFDLQTWLLAIGGSIVVLLIYGVLTRGSRKA